MVLIFKLLFVFAALLTTSCASTKYFAKEQDKGKNISIYSSADQNSSLRAQSLLKPTDAALAMAEEKLAENPNDVETILTKANLLFVRGDYEGAEKLCKQALSFDLANLDAKKLLAQIHFRQGNFEIAKIILNSLGGDTATDPQILNVMALIAIKEDRGAQAMELFKKALKKDPSELSIRLNLGVLHLGYRELNAAATQFERVLKIMPENQDALLHMAIIEAARGNKVKAYDLYDALLSNKSRNPLALYNLAVLQMNDKLYAEAQGNFEEYLRIYPQAKEEGKGVAELISEIDEYIKGQALGRSDEQIKKMAMDLKPIAAKADADSQEIKEVAPPRVVPQVKNQDDDIESLEKKLEL